VTEADLLFAVRVLETPLGPSLEYDADHPVARERAAVSGRYHGLKAHLGTSDASRLARAEWLGRFLAARQGESRRADELEVLLAWESGELSEGQTCRLLGDLSGGTTDPVTARGMREAALAAVKSRWERWRACNPPSPGSGP
jgi:hypothetical protein